TSVHVSGLAIADHRTPPCLACSTQGRHGSEIWSPLASKGAQRHASSYGSVKSTQQPNARIPWDGTGLAAGHLLARASVFHDGATEALRATGISCAITPKSNLKPKRSRQSQYGPCLSPRGLCPP